MVLDTLKNAARYAGLKDGCSEAFGFLDQPGLADLPDGRYEVAGEKVFAIVDRTQGRKISDGKLEGHRKFIDIQYVISGDESMGWSPAAGLTNAVPYDEERDLEFFEGNPQSIVHVPPGSFAVFLPTDAHLPLIGEGPIHKVVVKVSVGDS
ncbi:MAG: YhcH/YjgK/YiaL family protein [Pontiellaceae bacterium]|nr:YhcH/YjgK/YiaL family protein [Pontiellaceae bacterium]MBN2786676.1 YhcH/YjgK/YiaL family protein [Pontiellaceae bacterium]